MNADDGVDGGPGSSEASSDDVDLATLLDVADATGIVDDVSTVESVETTLPSGSGTPDGLSSILVAIGDGPHSGATVDLASALARESGAWLELFHVVPDGGSGGGAVSTEVEDASSPRHRDAANDSDDSDGPDDAITAGEGLLSAAKDRVGECDRIDTWLFEGDSPASAIVEQSSYYDAVVLGAPTSGRVERFVLGSTTGTVRSDAVCPVIVVTAAGSTPIVFG
ncbi:universal stress protein [Halopenitus salinus]|uniref:Universal stress protein n=1 Tax=Halopenitus salinus TaxID=1198295 RepID=A0ABD5UWS1_9EURY